MRSGNQHPVGIVQSAQVLSIKRSSPDPPFKGAVAVGDGLCSCASCFHFLTYLPRWVLPTVDTPHGSSLMGLDLDFSILFLTFLSSQKYIPSLPPWLLQLMLRTVWGLLGEKKWRGTRIELRICCLSATEELYRHHGLTSRHVLTAVQPWA